MASSDALPFDAAEEILIQEYVELAFLAVGFLGYPLRKSADILVYEAIKVSVGEGTPRMG